MKVKTVRNSLGLYFTITVTLIGAYLLIAAHSVFLPLDEGEAKGIFEIVVPVFIGQVATVFQWMSHATPEHISDEAESPLPAWVIILPPTLTLLIFASGTFALVASNQPDSTLHVGPETFRSIVTFALAILNASTILLVPRIFPAPQKPKPKKRGG